MTKAKKISFSILLISLVSCLSTNAIAQPILDRPFNRPNLFENLEVCDAYRSFLNENSGPSFADCHPLARLLIENDDLEYQDYIDQLISVASDRSGLGLNARLAKSLFSTDFVEVLNAANLASIRVSIGIASTTDADRSFVYLHLIREISNKAVIALCADPDECRRLRSGSILSDAYGEGVMRLNSIRPDVLFYCLLKTDAYLVPIEEVLTSQKYRSCLASAGHDVWR